MNHSPSEWFSIYKKSTGQTTCALSYSSVSGSLDLTRTEAVGAHIDVLGRTVDDRLHPLDIGLPRPVGAAVRVGNLDAEHDALVAEITFSHSFLPPHWFMITFSGAGPTNAECLKSIG